MSSISIYTIQTTRLRWLQTNPVLCEQRSMFAIGKIWEVCLVLSELWHINCWNQLNKHKVWTEVICVAEIVSGFRIRQQINSHTDISNMIQDDDSVIRVRQFISWKPARWSGQWVFNGLVWSASEVSNWRSVIDRLFPNVCLFRFAEHVNQHIRYVYLDYGDFGMAKCELAIRKIKIYEDKNTKSALRGERHRL